MLAKKRQAASIHRVNQTDKSTPRILGGPPGILGVFLVWLSPVTRQGQGNFGGNDPCIVNRQYTFQIMYELDNNMTSNEPNAP